MSEEKRITFLKFSKWFKNYWQLIPLLALSMVFYWVLWKNIYAIGVSVALIAVLAVKYKRTIETLKKYWPVVVVLVIISLSMWIRMVGFYSPDGSDRWPYLRNIDSYFFYRQINDIVQNNGVTPSHDYLMNAPEGFDRGHSSYDLYYYGSAYSYYFIRLLFPGMTLLEFLAWFPALIACLIVIPSYYIGKTLFDRKAGVLAALFMVLMVPFIARSLGGDPDSDGVVMVLMISSIAAFLVAYKSLDKDNIFSRKNIFYSAIAGLVLALFAFSWSTYWFALVVIVGFIVFKLIINLVTTRSLRTLWELSKSMIVGFVILMAVFYLITVPYYGVGFFANPVTSIFGSFGGAASVKGEAGNYPNVYVSVAELMAGGQASEVVVKAAGVDIAAGVTGIPTLLLILISPFILTLLCFVYLMYSFYRRRLHLDTLLFMGIWFLAFVFASVIAVRATIFLAPVYAICLALIVAKGWRMAIGEDKEFGD